MTWEAGTSLTLPALVCAKARCGEGNEGLTI